MWEEGSSKASKKGLTGHRAESGRRLSVLPPGERRRHNRESINCVRGKKGELVSILPSESKKGFRNLQEVEIRVTRGGKKRATKSRVIEGCALPPFPKTIVSIVRRRKKEWGYLCATR